MSDADAPPVSEEEKAVYLDNLDYVWDVEEQLDDTTDIHPHSEDYYGRVLVREMQGWHAVAVFLTVRAEEGELTVIEQDGVQHRIPIGGGCWISGDHITVGPTVEGDASRLWTIRPSASPVRHRFKR